MPHRGAILGTQRKVWGHALRPLDEQPHGFGSLEVWSGVGRGQGQAAQLQHPLVAHSQPLAGCRQQGDAGLLGEDAADEGYQCVATVGAEQVFQIVEQQQQRALAQADHELVEDRAGTLNRHAQRLGDRQRHSIHRSDGGQPGDAHSIRKGRSRGEIRGNLERQAGLADAARPGHCHQAPAGIAKVL